MKAIIRKDEEAVSPVIATILMVAITVVLAAVLYVMVSGLIGGPQTSKPVIQLTVTGPVTNGEQISISGASQNLGPANYKVNLKINLTTGSALAMPTTGGGSVSLAVAGYTGTFSVMWTDIGGEGFVNQGDSFTITRTGGLPAGSSYTLYLLWSDGSSLTSTSFSTA